MKLIIDISKDRYDEIMAMDWKNCRRFFDEEIRAIHDGIPQRTDHWIPVSERLPDDEQDVLITVKNYKDVSKVSVSTDVFYNDGEDGCYFETYNFDDVIAWMPFPTPYQPENPIGAEGSEE